MGRPRSRKAAGVPGIRQRLRPYQLEAGRAILDSVLHGKGHTFTVEVARQGGKNELSAQLEVLLLTLNLTRSVNLVKCAPTFSPQVVTSMVRLKERLDDAGFAGLWAAEKGYMVRLGRARVLFFSADGSSHVVGATAHVLLEVDEAQDVPRDKYVKEFRPMAASTNATTVLYGTAWDDNTLLEETKQTNLALERSDGVKRHFRYDWQAVAACNPAYGAFVEAERERLGEDHPLFRTQYALQPLRGAGGFLGPQQRALMVGNHPRRHQPLGDEGPDVAYVAGVDLAGAAEGEEGVQRGRQRRDSTVVTVLRADHGVPDHGVLGPRLEVVEHYCWTGTPHHELYARLAELLGQLWGCRRVYVDATGVGAGVAGFLEKTLGRGVVTPFAFSAQSKSRLGFELLAAVNAGRLKMYAHEGSEEGRRFWQEMERARSSFRAGQTMNFYVDPAEGHDDFLVSLALAVAAAGDYRPRRARGRLRESASVGS